MLGFLSFQSTQKGIIQPEYLTAASRAEPHEIKAFKKKKRKRKLRKKARTIHFKSRKR